MITFYGCFLQLFEKLHPIWVVCDSMTSKNIFSIVVITINATGHTIFSCWMGFVFIISDISAAQPSLVTSTASFLIPIALNKTLSDQPL